MDNYGIALTNKDLIVNSIKLLIYKEDPELLEMIPFENDDIFLEPLLFAYFNQPKFKGSTMLKEVLYEYFCQDGDFELNESFNKKEISFIPNKGYYLRNENQPFESIYKINDLEILKHEHPLLDNYFFEFYKGHILENDPKREPTWNIAKYDFEKALNIIEKYLPNFYKSFKFSNRRIFFHDNPKILNFTSVETLGMLYFYIISDKNLIYFIEELIHQGSHNYLYFIVHNRSDFFKIDVDNLVMRDFTKQEWDYRTIYGAFHGLFTVKQRVESFDKLLTQNVFSGREKHELMGRLIDQFSRFRTGLELLDCNEVFTEKGIEFYNELDAECESILKKYEKLMDKFDLSNREVDFRYNDFCKLNSLEDFLIKDKQGLYDL